MARGWTDEQLKAASEVSKTVADVCRYLGIVPRGGSYEVVRRHMKRLGIARLEVRFSRDLRTFFVTSLTANTAMMALIVSVAKAF